ncbi:TIGR01777 family oxidoreductase [Herpetosiphon llansteffanensis]
MQLVIVGGSGQIGQLLTSYWRNQGHSVQIMGRSTSTQATISWDAVRLGPWVEHLEHSDVLINLTGKSVNCRYTAANRRELWRSRIETTRLLGQAIQQLSSPPRLWLQASGSAIYAHSNEPQTEAKHTIGGNEMHASARWQFNVDLVKAWEYEAVAAKTPHTRKIMLRTSMMMSHDRGGVFDILCRLARSGLGGTIGNGQQYVAWIHSHDLVRAIAWLIEQPDLAGPINLSAPQPLPNHQFMRHLRQALNTRFGVPIPSPLMQIGAWMLRTEAELVLKSRNVIPQRLLEHGFRFEYPSWPEAVTNLLQLR